MSKMSHICQSCGQWLFPLPQWKEQVDALAKAYHNGCSEELHSAKSIVNDLAMYIEGLQKEQEAASKALESVRVFLAPVNRVPDDILVCIFRELFTTEVETEDEDLIASIIHRYTLVCKRWRRILVSIPGFWTRIYLTPSPEPALCQFLERQLGYAGSLPLEVVCYDGPKASSLNILGAALGRIRSLHASPQYEDVEEALSTCSLLPGLCRLRLDIYGESGPPGLHLDTEAPAVVINLPHSSAPVLTDVELHIGIHLKIVNLPWSQLTTLIIDQWPGGDLDPYSIITSLEKIERLKLQLMHSVYLHPPNLGRLRVTLPHLRILTLTGSETEEISFQLLQESNLPSLEELDFNLMDNHRRFVEAMHNPQIRTLVKLKIHFFNSFISGHSPDEVWEVMSSLYEFEHLEEFSCDIDNQPHATDRVFVPLSQNHFGRCLFPRLRSLELVGADLTLRALEAVRALFQNRVSPVGVPADSRKALRTVQVSFDSPDTDLESYFVLKTPSKQIFKPAQYNDAVTSVTFTLKSYGELVAGFLEESLEGL